MEVYGLREAADVDVIISGSHETGSQIRVNDDIFEKLSSGWFRDSDGNIIISDEQLVRDPECHFYYEGIKFVNLEFVYCYKNALKKNKAQKDEADLEMIRDLISEPSKPEDSYVPAPDFKRRDELSRIITEISDGLDFSRIPPACPVHKARFSERLEMLKQYFRDNGINLNDVCIANSAVLEVCGLRVSDDFDVLVSGRLSDVFPREVVPLIDGKAEKLYTDWLRDKNGNILISDDQLIDDPACHFWYEGMKFVRLDIVYGYKKILSREKDIADMAMIREYIYESDANSGSDAMPPEYHIFILWEKAQPKKADILSDIQTDMHIIKVCDITWDKKFFSENLTRFYGLNLPKNSFKEKHVGNGTFTLIFVKDPSPRYQKRLTSKGIKSVNVNMFDRKELYRRWTGGGHKVHATNSETETRHDLAFLLGMTPEDVEMSADKIPGELKMNTAGLNAWDSLDTLFYVLGRSVNLVLRNFEYLPDKFSTGEHGDIDLLVDDYDEAVRALSGKKVFTEKYRVHYCTRVGSELVYFDLRHVGDKYYCTEWEKDMLMNRCNSGRGFYIPSRENYRWSLMYHALIHKPQVSDEYRHKLGELFDFPEEDYVNELKKFLDAHNYSITCPEDLSVYFNEGNAGIKRGLKRKHFGRIRCKLKNIYTRLLRS